VSTPPQGIEVVLEGPGTPAWQARALAGLRESPLLRVLAVRELAPARSARPRRLHTRIERRLLRLGPDALAPEPDGSEAARRRGAAAEGGAAEGGAAKPGGAGAEGAAATLLVWLAERPPPPEEQRAVIYLRHDGSDCSADEAFGRAVLGREGGVGTEVLLRLAGGEGRADLEQAANLDFERGGEVGGALVLERTVSGVRPFSLSLSRDLALWKLASTVPRAAERASVALAGGVDLASLPAARPPAAKRRAPSNPALAARSALVWPRVLLTRLLFRRPWSVRVRRREQVPTAGWSREQRLVRFERGRLYADPFLFEHEGRHHLFCEEVPPGQGRAVISHTELHADGSVAEAPRCVLSRPYHLSYPFVFAREGEVFMIPESSAAERVELYRAVEFPLEWELDSVLIDRIDAADATLLEHDGRLWLFAGVAAADASSLDELHLFSANELRGPWRAHPRNPVVSDARRARPAGAVQRWGSRLVRPGQDGSRRYGGSIAFCEIDLLSESDYAEHEIARLDPADVGGARATHTYASDGAFEAIDLRSRELRLGAGFARRG
jgi:hypothetical protein